MSARETWLVTGGSGCIGAWTVAELLREGARVVSLQRSLDDHRLRLIVSPGEIGRIGWVLCDVTDLAGLERVLDEHEVTHVVHLAALQVPFCRADPPLGARVNVVGTTNVLEAVRRRGPGTSLVYASSSAVYDAAGESFTPTTIYGVQKLAAEGSARIFWEEHGVASVGLRPLVVYGPGRDQGVTAAPTQAMAAAARGEPFHIPFGGSMQLQLARDVAHAFVEAARRPPEGARVLNLGGPVVSMAEIVAAVKAAVPAARVTFDDVPLPFPPRLPEPWFDLHVTPLEQGVRETVELLARAHERREVDPA